MAIENVGGSLRFISDVEPWMAGQWSTEVFNFSIVPYSDDEMKITEILDGLLHDVVFGREGIDESVARASKARLVKGRRPKRGEQSLGSWLGSGVDAGFKSRVDTSLLKGDLAPYHGRVRTIPRGKEGPDVVMDGVPLIAWDVTTQADIETHIRRDSIGGVKRRERLYDRYYLLVWDDPRTKKNTLLKALALAANR